MDQVNRDGFESGIPGLVFPEAYMLVVPMGAKHDEEGLFEEVHTLKKELSRVALLPTAQDCVFTDCRMMIELLDEERHTDGVLLWNRQHDHRDKLVFVFSTIKNKKSEENLSHNYDE
jgi:hypothetical protein